MNKYKPIKISKEEISKLETDAFSGRIIVVQNEQDIEKAISISFGFSYSGSRYLKPVPLLEKGNLIL